MSSEHLGECDELRRMLERYDREWSDLFHGIAHDLRAPLRTIEGFTQAVVEDYASALGEEGTADLERVRSAAANMERMIARMLDLAGVTRIPLRRESVDASSMAAEIAAALQNADPSRTVTFSIEPDVIVEADKQLLSVLLRELFANAWKFTSRQSAATISFGRREVDGVDELFVRDDGPGFTPAHGSKLFVPFQRLHSQKEFPGDGLGLAIVRRIVHRHLGSVDAEGTPGGGTTVRLRFGMMYPSPKEQTRQ